MKKIKGFTLIELLAVIVILALLVLVATPAITRIMTSSTKSSFKNEVIGMVSYMEDAFTEKMAKEVKSSNGEVAANATNIYNITASDEGTSRGYAYLCMTLKQLQDEQYMKKNLGESYGGYIQMWVPDGSGATITYVNITNGRYFLQGRMTEVSSSDFVASQTAGEGVTKPTADVSCPTEATPIPSTINVQEK